MLRNDDLSVAKSFVVVGQAKVGVGGVDLGPDLMAQGGEGDEADEIGEVDNLAHPLPGHCDNMATFVLVQIQMV